MKAFPMLPVLACAAAMLAGCGGGGDGVGPLPAPPQMETGEVSVGPFVMRPSAATSMQVRSLPSTGYAGGSFAVFSGVTIDYVAVRELMDRVVFSSDRGTGWPLYICDFFGESVTQFTYNNGGNATPAWSPDGAAIAWTFYHPSLQGEIMKTPSAGGGHVSLTNNFANDEHPTWSPDGRWIAFHSDRTANSRIFKMLEDGSNQMLVLTPAMLSNLIQPDWSPVSSEILYVSDAGGNDQIYRVNADGSGEAHLIFSGANDSYPAWHPGGNDIVYKRWMGSGRRTEIYGNDTSDCSEELMVTSSGTDSEPCYSTDGRFLFFVSTREGGSESIWAKQTRFPYRLYRITDAAGADKQPDLGGQTVQVSRVLIGPSGSDHGYEPIHNAAVAGVVAFSHEGYLNFVRLGAPSSSGTSLTATPLEDTGMYVTGVVLSAPDMYYLEEDAGVGVPPTMWDFGGGTCRTAALYFNAFTGKLISVMDMGDSVHAAAAGGATGITHEQSGASTVARGDFRRVYGADGELVAEGEIGAVEIDSAAGVVRAF